MALKRSLLVITAFAGIYFLQVAAQSKHATGEQRTFGAEDQSPKHPIPLPAGVKDLLRHDDYVADSLRSENLTADQLPDSWFMASVVHLAGLHEEDIVVLGKCPVCGANFVPFWAFRPYNDEYQKILFTGVLGATIDSKRSNGYRNISTGIVTMQTSQEQVWRFDGEGYQPTKKPAKRRHASE
jgi:hypothetical protein